MRLKESKLKTYKVFEKKIKETGYVGSVADWGDTNLTIQAHAQKAEHKNVIAMYGERSVSMIVLYCPSETLKMGEEHAVEIGGKLYQVIPDPIPPEFHNRYLVELMQKEQK